ncbi:unnamed protein product [Mortierella alpina]
MQRPSPREMQRTRDTPKSTDGTNAQAEASRKRNGRRARHAAATLFTDSQVESSRTSQELNHAEPKLATGAMAEPARKAKVTRRKSKEMKHVEATDTTDAKAGPSRKVQELPHVEAIDATDAQAEPSRKGQDSRHVEATLHMNAQAEPSRKATESRHVEATIAADAQAKPSRKRNRTRAKQVQTPMAEATTARPSKRADAPEPSEAACEPTDGRPSKRSRNALSSMQSSVQDNSARDGIVAAVQQAGRRGRSVAKPRASNRVQRPSATGTGVDKITAIVQHQDEQDIEMPLIVAEGSVFPGPSATARGVEKIPVTVQYQDEPNEMPMIAAKGPGLPRSSTTGTGVEKIPVTVQYQDEPNNEMPTIVAEGPRFPGSSTTDRGVDKIPATVQYQDEPKNEMPMIAAEVPGFTGSSTTGRGVEKIPATVQHQYQDEPNNEMLTIAAEGPGFTGSSTTGRGVEKIPATVQHQYQDEPNNEMLTIAAEGPRFPGSSTTGRGVEEIYAIVQHHDEYDGEKPLIAAEGPGFPGSSTTSTGADKKPAILQGYDSEAYGNLIAFVLAEGPAIRRPSATDAGIEKIPAIVQHQDEPDNEMPMIAAEGPGFPGPSTTARGVEKPPVTEQHQYQDDPNSERPMIAAERPGFPGSSTTGTGVEKIHAIVQHYDEYGGEKPLKVNEESGFLGSSATSIGVEKIPAIAQHEDVYDGEPGSFLISTEQSSSKHALAADNHDVTRRSQRKVKAAPVDDAAPQQSQDRDGPIEMVCEQAMDPFIVAKKGRGRPRKAARAELVSSTNDPTGTPSGDPVMTSAPAAEDTVQDTALRPHGRQQSPIRIRIGTKRNDTEPAEVTTKKPRTKTKAEPAEATSRKPRAKAKPSRRGKTVYEDEDERIYEEAIKDRGVRMWETFPMDSNGCIDKWAEMLGVPMRTLPMSEDKECLTFPFDMQELQATGSAHRVKAFIFFGPDSLQREPPKGDMDSFAIPFLSQQSVGHGHAVDSCASLSFVNIAMNSPEILQNGPAAMQQLRATLDDDEKVQSIKHAWRVFDQSEMGEQVHEVHNRIAVAEDGMDVDLPSYNPKDHMKKTRYSQRKAQAIQQEASAAASSSAAGAYEANEDAFHFTALLKIGGQVWELDSMETEPIKISSGEGSDWHVEVSKYLQSLTKDLSTYQKNYNCRLIAVV